MKRIITVLFAIFLSTTFFGCMLKPTEIREEDKDYKETIHNVEKANYEFEERLESFYQSEYIDSKDLNKLYKGEYPDGVSDANSLRLHWKKARELAIAEFELQQEVQTSWKNASVSERPILTLDRDGGDFYRYYEYRIVKDNTEIGAIRIPTYRRTENFATSEVHVYSGETYIINPTLWGVYISRKMVENKNTEFYKSIKANTDKIVTDGFTFNFLYLIYDELGLDKKVKDVPAQDAYNQLYDIYSKHTGEISGAKKDISDYDKSLIIDAAVRKDTYDYRKALTSIKKIMFKLESSAVLTESFKENLFDAIPNIASIDFIKGISSIAIKMSDSEANTLMRKTIKDIYWYYLENQSDNTVKNFLLNNEIDIYKELDNKEIQPVIEYPEYSKYPQRQKSVNAKYKFQEYKVVSSIEEHKKLTHSISGFISKDGFKSSLFEHMKDADGHEFEKDLINLIKNNTKEKYNNKSIASKSYNINYSSLSDNYDINDEFNELFNDILFSFTDWDKNAKFFGSFFIKEAGYIALSSVSFSIGGPVGVVVGVVSLITGIVTGVIDAVKEIIYRITDVFETIFKKIDKEIGRESISDFLDFLDEIKNQEPFKSNEDLQKILGIGESVGKYYIEHGPGFVKQAFFTVFDWWVI